MFSSSDVCFPAKHEDWKAAKLNVSPFLHHDEDNDDHKFQY